ncbi:MarR family winged helix-turn-helix transcriptional regulator [Streptomyces apocyni]|uniref:MarR family winged helix-turn-helix transcriptional regulator n=1 Tax=Streptomyces apocyni TaxID=2654677 RepID=UPI0012EA106F|nr:MarR family winged helix-turn-helix transcriptional regulator [Streptomyces apocyni]
MKYSHNDTELAQQPIGYWAWAASDAVVTYIRAGLSRFGITQPQWWVMAQIANTETDGRTREEATAVLQGYLAIGDALAPEIDSLLDQGLITLDADKRLHLTTDGADRYRQCAELQMSIRAKVHEGITDEEYVRTLKVLQRMIHNANGKAWHH